MGEDAESDFAIPFVGENDYSEISAKAVSAKRKLKKNRPLLYRANSTVGKSLTHTFTVWREQCLVWYLFLYKSFIIQQNNTWRSTCLIRDFKIQRRDGDKNVV